MEENLEKIAQDFNNRYFVFSFHHENSEFSGDCILLFRLKGGLLKSVLETNYQPSELQFYSSKINQRLVDYLTQRNVYSVYTLAEILEDTLFGLETKYYDKDSLQQKSHYDEFSHWFEIEGLSFNDKHFDFLRRNKITVHLIDSKTAKLIE